MYIKKLRSRCSAIETYPIRPVRYCITLKQSVVNGQVLDSDGDVSEVDMSVSPFKFSDFSVKNLSLIGHNPTDFVFISPSALNESDFVSRVLQNDVNR